MPKSKTVNPAVWFMETKLASGDWYRERQSFNSLEEANETWEIKNKFAGKRVRKYVPATSRKTTRKKAKTAR